MSSYTTPVQVLIDELGRLPGIGPKSAQRIAFHLLKVPADDVHRLASALTEAKAKERGYEVKVVKFPFQANGKALGLNDYVGFVKIVTDAKYGEVLGAHMIGPEVTELLGELTLAHGAELTIEEIARNVHAHPSLSETIMEAAHGAVGGYINI
jgi:hypothetical protein